MPVTDAIHAETKSQLHAIVQRIERLEEEKAALASDIKEVYLEAKSNGYDVKILRKVVSLRKKEEHARLEEEALLSTYLAALGMLGDTPLGQAAVAQIGHTSRTAQSHRTAPKASAEAEIAANVAKARDEGAAAAMDGLSLASNPYLSDDPRGRAWDRGYAEANVHAAA